MRNHQDSPEKVRETRRCGFADCIAVVLKGIGARNRASDYGRRWNGRTGVEQAWRFGLIDIRFPESSLYLLYWAQMTSTLKSRPCGVLMGGPRVGSGDRCSIDLPRGVSPAKPISLQISEIGPPVQKSFMNSARNGQLFDPNALSPLPLHSISTSLASQNGEYHHAFVLCIAWFFSLYTLYQMSRREEPADAHVLSLRLALGSILSPVSFVNDTFLPIRSSFREWGLQRWPNWLPWAEAHEFEPFESFVCLYFRNSQSYSTHLPAIPRPSSHQDGSSFSANTTWCSSVYSFFVSVGNLVVDFTFEACQYGCDFYAPSIRTMSFSPL